MDVEAVDLPLRRRGVEGLVVYLSQLLAVNGVGKVRAQPLKVEQRRAVADLLVGREAHGNAAMRALLVYDALSGGHYRGDAGLVVRAENGGAVGGDEGLTLEGSQMRELFDRQAAPARAEDDVAAVIVLDELRLNVLAGEVGYGVKMGDEADAGLVLIALARGDEAVNIGVLVLIYALQPKRAHLVGQHVAQRELAVAARHALRGLGACGVGLDIGDKSFVGFHCAVSLCKIVEYTFFPRHFNISA